MSICFLRPSLFVDNVGVIYNVVNGSSTAPDIAAITFYIRLLLHHFMITPWVEHVPSESNLADGGSRVGTEDPNAEQAGVTLTFVNDVVLPDDFPGTAFSDWAAHLQRRVATS